MDKLHRRGYHSVCVRSAAVFLLLALSLVFVPTTVADAATPRLADTAHEAAAATVTVVSLRIGQKWAGRGLHAVQLDAAPYVADGRTLVPVRFLAESLGFHVSWEQTNQTVTLTGPSTAVIRIGERQWTLGGSVRQFDVPPVLHHNRTFLPLRAIAEAMGAEVVWDGDSQTVIVSRLGRQPHLRDLERFAVQLINIERAAAGLPELAWDETAAAAGRQHAADMATGGFFSHWNRAGDLPIERYNRQGGRDAVAENLATWFWRDPPAGFYAGPDWARVIRHHEGLMRSTGHRNNTLDRWHTHVGVGIAENRYGSTYLAAEFVDRYGVHDRLPDSVAVGERVTISGQLYPGVKLHGITLTRRVPEPLTVPELEQTGAYSAPWPPYAQYYPEGYITPVPVHLDGNAYSLTVALSDDDAAGTYYVYVWAAIPGSSEPRIISMQTVSVR